MRHSRRTTLTTDDVDSALKLRNVEVRHIVNQMWRSCGLHSILNAINVGFIIEAFMCFGEA